MQFARSPGSRTTGLWIRLKGIGMTTTTSPIGISENAASAISYFTFFPAALFLLVSPYKNSGSVRFHAWQSMLLFIAAFVVEIVFGAIALLTIGSVVLVYVLRVLSLVWIVVWLICVIRAMNGKRFRVPLLGGIAEKLAMK
jgi:uncharacterized membrane protein